MENPTLPQAGTPETATPVVVAPTAAAHRDDTAARAWLGVNLLAIAASAYLFGAGLTHHVLLGWSAFVALNALFWLVARHGLVVGRAAAGSPAFNASLAGITGAAWGALYPLLLPAATATPLVTLGLVLMTVASSAIPLLGDGRGTARTFISALCAVSAAALAFDGRFVAGIPWILCGWLTLFVLAGVYQRDRARQRGYVETMLREASTEYVPTALRGLDEADIGARVDRHVTAFADLRDSDNRHRRMMQAIGDAMISTDADGRIDYVNPVAEVLLGADLRQLQGRPLEDGMRLIVPPDQKNQARDILKQVRLTRRTQHGEDNVQLVRRDGVVYGIEYVVSPARNDNGDFAGAVLLIRDVTERRRRAETIAWQATHDPLTGTINRTEFELRLKRLVRRAQDDTNNVHALLYIDIDKFKFVNDSYGHAAGDAALKQLTDVLRTRIRGADTLARVGGDEFTALLYSCSAEKARLIAEGLRVAVERHEFGWDGIELPISLSIGIVEINRECQSVAEIIRAADAAAYTAKKFGRNRVHVFDRRESGESRQARVFDFVKDIQTAIHGNRLELFYQPLFPTGGDTNARRCELSVGMRDGNGDMIARARLTDLARRYQLTEEIDRWVVKAAFDALSLNHPALRNMDLVLVPLFQQSLADERLLEYIAELVKEHGDLAGRIGFTLEEAETPTHLEYIRYFVTMLKQHGCRFMIGDMGFSAQSVELVRSMQADYLGIPASLVNDMLHSSADYEVVLGLSRIARALGMETIALGAEAESVRDALFKMGVDYVRGGANSAPQPVTIASEAQWI